MVLVDNYIPDELMYSARDAIISVILFGIGVTITFVRFRIYVLFVLSLNESLKMRAFRIDSVNSFEHMISHWSIVIMRDHLVDIQRNLLLLWP